jgi:hypothetical protein
MVGEKLGSFRIEGTLGVGAMGVVYRAVHESTNKPAAVKVVNKEVSQRGKIYERFRREAEILRQFRHANIVRFHALGRYKGTSYIAMEYVQGKTLEQVLGEHGALPWSEVVKVGIQTCDALHYAHEHGVIHRDLKPSNLMITDEGQVKLTDFGIAKDLDKTALTATGRTLGTAAYMAPEQIRGNPAVSHKTDLYAMGAVLYQMLTGQTPFEGASAVVLMHCHLNEPVPRPSAKVAEIPKALDDLVVQLMAKAPADRPWDAAAVGHTLSQLRQKTSKGEAVPMVWPSDGSGPSPARLGGPPKKKKAAGRGRGSSTTDLGDVLKRFETAGLVLALLAIAGLAAYLYWPASDEQLFAQAEKLWNAGGRENRLLAIERYLDPLDRRNPNHRYREKTQAWREEKEQEDLENRLALLEGPVLPRHNLDEYEKEWRTTLQLAEGARAVGQKGKHHDDPEAVRLWNGLAEQFRGDDPKHKRYARAAKKQASKVQDDIDLRLKEVERRLQQIKDHRSHGRLEQEAARRDELREMAKQYADVDEYLRQDPDVAEYLGLTPPTTPAAAPAPSPAPAPAAAPSPSPSTPAEPVKSAGPDAAPR